MILLAAQHSTQTIDYVMSPTGDAVLLLLALVVDYMSIGPDSFRDRLAFFMALPAIYDGFRGGPLATWTVGALASLIDQLKEASGTAKIAGASTNAVIGAAVGITAIFAVGCLAPNTWGKSLKLGNFASLTWPKSSGRLNKYLWLCAITLGLFADLPHGAIGNALRSSITLLARLVAPLPNFLFGVS